MFFSCTCNFKPETTVTRKTNDAVLTRLDAPFALLHVSSVNTYNYNLVSYLGILQQISTDQHTVKDSCSFADWAKHYKHNYKIINV